ncbi:IS4 family transposase [Dyella choica]|uniref:IS4 family transposase n=1 Tax=Dyella choica TaxID=1927959 RepID=A0A3S0PJJ9_9GAMM|nr:IS4 family transposase [Dyella choica]RUL67695.1 IS4 family transposase [Dyella choica]
MRASGVLQKCLSDGLRTMHAARSRVLLHAVEALLAGRRLTLMDVARSWPGAERVRAPLKAFDRLLSNRHLHAERERVYASMAQWLLRGERPVIVIDWSDLKADKAWCLLRAAVPVGGRTLPILDMVFPGVQAGSPVAEQRFLQRLKQIVPASATPILVTDAGFRSPWFRAVDKLGWYWLGRLRHNTLVKPVEVHGKHDWVPSRALYELGGNVPKDMGLMDAVRDNPWVCRIVLYRKKAKGRKHRNLNGKVVRSKHSRKSAAREGEPWLLVASPSLELHARQLVMLYARRMQIESSFRDLKSHRYGQGFEDSLTRVGKRIEILLLVNTLATFASWLAGLASESTGIARWLSPVPALRRLYSVVRTGREALVRDWPMERISQWLMRLRELPTSVADQMCAPL